MPKLQQVKIMFTPEAAHKINAACKGSSVTPLDSENQRVFNDVFDHGAEDGYYTVELNSGKGFSYPNRNIERVRSSWQKIALHDAVSGGVSLYDDEVYDLDDELATEYAEIDAELAVELAEIEADFQAEIADL